MTTMTEAQTQYDWSALNANFSAYISAGSIPSSDGGTLRNPTEWKREDMFTALHQMATEHRAGTLTAFTSHNHAGQDFWRRVHAMPARGTRWQYDYSDFAPPCEAIGRFLETNRPIIESAPVVAGRTPDPVHEWPVGEGLNIPCYRISDGSLYVMRHVYGDGSATLRVNGVDCAISAFHSDHGLKEDYAPLTTEDVLEFTQGRVDGRGNAAGDRVSMHQDGIRTNLNSLWVRQVGERANWGLASLSNLRVVVPSQPLRSTYVRPDVARGQRVLHRDGRMLSVSQGDRDNGWMVYCWTSGGEERHTETIQDSDIVFVLEEGVTRLRVIGQTNAYNMGGLTMGREVTYQVPYSTSDRALWFTFDQNDTDTYAGSRRYNCHSIFEVVRPVEALPVREAPYRGRDAWRLSDGTCLYVRDIREQEQGHGRRALDVHEWGGDSWDLRSAIPVSSLLLAESGDAVTVTSGTYAGRTGTYHRPATTAGATSIVVIINGVEVTLPRNAVRYAGAGVLSTVESPKIATIEHDGEEYVRLADVLADHTKAVEILHKGADDNGLCSVYDKVGRQVDAETVLFKMGSRPRRRRMKGTVTIEVAYDLLTDDPHRMDDDAVKAITDQITAHIGVPTQAPNPGNAYSWRVNRTEVQNTFNEIA